MLPIHVGLEFSLSSVQGLIVWDAGGRSRRLATAGRFVVDTVWPCGAVEIVEQESEQLVHTSKNQLRVMILGGRCR
jgi:hypothetical protein